MDPLGQPNRFYAHNDIASIMSKASLCSVGLRSSILVTESVVLLADSRCRTIQSIVFVRTPMRDSVKNISAMT